MATFAEIKKELGIEKLKLVKSVDQNENPTDWYRMWDNAKRINISVHKDTLHVIMNEPGNKSFSIQTEERTSPTSNLTYVNHRIVGDSAEIIL